MYQKSFAEVLTEDTQSAKRYPVTWPVEFEAGGTRTTLDLSAYGARIETDLELKEGSVRFSVRVPERPGGPTRLVCEGRVVRAEPLGARWEVSVVFDSIRFEV